MIMRLITNIIHFLYKSISKFYDIEGTEYAGYMSFMLLLSLFPFLVFFLSFTSFFGFGGIGKHFIIVIIDDFPPEVISFLQTRIVEILKHPPASMLNLAIIGTVWTSASFVDALRSILNRIYGLPNNHTYLWRRFTSILEFFIINFLIILMIFLLIIIPNSLAKYQIYKNFLDNLHFFMKYLRYVTIFITLFLAVSFLYYRLPNKKMQYYNVIYGSIVTVILWIISSVFLSKYLIYYTKLNLIYGSIASIIITMIFFFVLNMIFIYGAILNNIYETNK